MVLVGVDGGMVEDDKMDRTGEWLAENRYGGVIIDMIAVICAAHDVQHERSITQHKSFLPPFSLHHPLSALPHLPPAMSAAAAATSASLSTSAIIELVHTVDVALRQAVAEGRCYDETIKHRKEIVHSSSSPPLIY